jgi:hypothetical protein
MDRGSFRALAVTAGDGTGPHMVKMADVGLKSPLQGKVTKSASRAVTPYRRSGLPSTPLGLGTFSAVKRRHTLLG